jgi:GNAT superfamily N-acetyltransferase
MCLFASFPFQLCEFIHFVLLHQQLLGCMIEGGGAKTTMRIRTYRVGDIVTLVHVQQQSAQFDGLEPMGQEEIERLLTLSMRRTGYNVFLITDDDDELNTWGQGESFDGPEGEVVGYTILYLSRGQQSYHFRCYGTVLPEHRGRGAGHALLLCAMNHARMQSIDFVFEARRLGQPIYFEVELPARDPALEYLVQMFELEESDASLQPGQRLYRTEL